ncbi:aspartate kinase [Fulvivirga lutea]|uniref:Aspartokinase n=1 Tax=Fulvivirga lutea TaxID=2810512 RepID=A0A974WFS3_9BACT|nr:aspartate kinase [Fulvivirga lutea]QSE97679.1 aspartate kinase [Fulvivirga lutea]
MKVFKFGGASIKSAEAIRNMASIVQENAQKELVVVVSAMGKTTNALESLLDKKRKGEDSELNELSKYHFNICDALFDNTEEITPKMNALLTELEDNLTQTSLPYDQHYDLVISYGELLSSLIVSEYLINKGLNVSLVDSRKYVITDDNYRNGYIDWDETALRIGKLRPQLEQGLILTQGFIGGTKDGHTTTLGREGSDYTAAIYSFCLDAESMTVWKDVPGILNADPKRIKEAELFHEIAYKEASEMTYYGASVIHPKTIKPLANKNIPLFVRSFDDPKSVGTIIHDCEVKHPTPSIIIKENQCLVSFNVLDYTFINEENLSLIFQELAGLDIKINIMQNSAISFSIVVDYREDKLEELIKVLKEHFEIKYNTGLELITIKNYRAETISQYRSGKNILLEQTSRNNYRALYVV